MLKKFLVVMGLAATVMFNGCLLDSGSEENNNISFSGIRVVDTVYVGSGNVAIEGKLEANSTISNIRFEVYNPDREDVTSSFSRPFDAPSNETKVDLEKQNARIGTETSSLISGTYRLEISGDVNGEISSTTISFQVKNNDGATNPDSDLEEQTITVAGHGHNTMGSSFDLDNGEVLLSSDATVAGSGVDLVYTYSNSRRSPVLLTPVYAKEDSDIGAFSGWDNPNDTEFHKVSTDYDAVTTKADVEELFDASQVSSSGRVTCAAGDVFVVKTDTGAYALLEMVTVSADDGGTANIKYAL
ncbi:MAG: hypothetical protein ACLFQB_09580 [Chitinispirillaceae bacterium]